MEFSQPVLTVRKFADCFGFYRDLLGLEVVGGGQAGPVAAFRSGQAKLTIVDVLALPPEAAGTMSGTPGAPRITLAFHSHDVDAEFVRLRTAGVKYAMEPTDFPQWHVRSSICADPDGNPIEITSPLTNRSS